MPITARQATAKIRKSISIYSKTFPFKCTSAACAVGLGDFSKVPTVFELVQENMLRFEDGKTVSTVDI
tara:strand:- start:82 stop:285 length:204 start_codon:yes stop_codon:yes gene_type:complete